MHALHLFCYLCGGALLSNALPHFVSGLMGRAFQSPFATPHGVGLSSATVNVLWGFANLVASYLLLAWVGDFGWRHASEVAAMGLGMLAMGLPLARHFGRLHGGEPPERA